MASIFSTFLRGLGVVAPVAITVWLIVWLARGAEALLRPAFLVVLPERLYVPGLGVALGIALVFAVGVLLQLFLVERIWGWLERQLARIPVVNTIYNTASDFLGFFSSDLSAGQSTVVRVDLAPEVQLIGFVTGAAPAAASSEAAAGGVASSERVAVYLPMSFQLGGFTVLVPRDRVTELDWSFEQATRWVVTAGVRRQPSPGARAPGGADGGPPGR